MIGVIPVVMADRQDAGDQNGEDRRRNDPQRPSSYLLPYENQRPQIQPYLSADPPIQMNVIHSNVSGGITETSHLSGRVRAGILPTIIERMPLVQIACSGFDAIPAYRICGRLRIVDSRDLTHFRLEFSI